MSNGVYIPSVTQGCCETAENARLWKGQKEEPTKIFKHLWSCHEKYKEM